MRGYPRSVPRCPRFRVAVLVEQHRRVVDQSAEAGHQAVVGLVGVGNLDGVGATIVDGLQLLDGHPVVVANAAARARAECPTSPGPY